MNTIVTQMVEADSDFYGGGGLASLTGPKTSGDTSNNIWNLLDPKGYTCSMNGSPFWNSRKFQKKK